MKKQIRVNISVPVSYVNISGEIQTDYQNISTTVRKEDAEKICPDFFNNCNDDVYQHNCKLFNSRVNDLSCKENRENILNAVIKNSVCSIILEPMDDEFSNIISMFLGSYKSHKSTEEHNRYILHSICGVRCLKKTLNQLSIDFHIPYKIILDLKDDFIIFLTKWERYNNATGLFTKGL